MAKGSGVMTQLGDTAFARGQVLAAKSYWSEALVEADSSGSIQAQVRNRNALGTLYLELGEPGQSLRLFTEALALIESQPALGSTQRTRVLLNCFLASYVLRRMDDAWRFVTDALDSIDESVDPQLRAKVHINMSAMYIDRQDWDNALQATDRALELYRNSNNELGTAQVIVNRGIATAGLRNPSCKDFFLEAIDIANNKGDYKTLAFAYTELAREALKTNEFDEALGYGRMGLHTLWSHFTTIDKAEIARVTEVFGRIAIIAGDIEGGLKFIQRAATYYAQSNLWKEWSSLNKLIDEELNGSRQRRDDSVPARKYLDADDLEMMEYFASLFSLLDILEGMYPGIRIRSEMVTRYALMLARHLGVGESEVDILSHAGRLHDIGLTCVDREIVDTSDKLSRAAQRRAEAHSVIGEQTLREFPVPSMCSLVTRHHHENWDGTGYPDGLCGDEIPKLSRLLAVTEVYVTNAMPKGHEEGIRAVLEEAGRRLDPILATSFVDMHDIGTLIPDDN